MKSVGFVQPYFNVTLIGSLVQGIEHDKKTAESEELTAFSVATTKYFSAKFIHMIKSG